MTEAGKPALSFGAHPHAPLLEAFLIQHLSVPPLTSGLMGPFTVLTFAFFPGHLLQGPRGQAGESCHPFIPFVPSTVLLTRWALSKY